MRRYWIETHNSIECTERQAERSGSLVDNSPSVSIGNNAADILFLSPSLSPFLSRTLPSSSLDDLLSYSVANVATQENGSESPLHPRLPDGNGNGIVGRDAIDADYRVAFLDINIDMNIGASDNGIDLEQFTELEADRKKHSTCERARQADSYTCASTNSTPLVSHLPSPVASASTYTSPPLPDGVKSVNVISANAMTRVPNSASNDNMPPHLVAPFAIHSQRQQVNDTCGSILSTHKLSEVYAYKPHKKRACIPCYISKVRCVGDR